MLTSSTFISDLYGLMRHILCLIFVAQQCNMTLPLVQHIVITNGMLYGVSDLYAELLTSMSLSPTL